MKIAIIRGLFLFGAGAGCATVIAQMDYPPPPITLGDFDQRMDKLLVDAAGIGIYLAYIDENKLAVNVAACPPSPRPKQPAGAVDPWSLQRALSAMQVAQTAHLVGQKEISFAVEKCRPYK
jgi:hypothetical protein